MQQIVEGSRCKSCAEKKHRTEAVEGIMLDFSNEEVHLTASAKAFLKMTNLRLLKILNLQLPAGLESLSDELRLLQWHGYPLKSLPSSMEMDKTLECNMCYRRIEQFWKGIKPLNKLKLMRLSFQEPD